jgi:phosphonate transport system substrate-binding protein
MRLFLRSFLLGTIFLSLITLLPSPACSSQKKILIGVLPEMNVFKQKQRFKLLGEYLSQKTGVPVEFTILSRYGNIVDRFTVEKMDGAFFGSFTGALAIKRLGVVPLARPVNLDGTSTYHGYLFTRKDSGIKNAKDMKGKRMAYVDKATTAGYIFPLAYLKDNGITDTSHFFKETFFAGSHDASIHAVLQKKADVGAAKHSVYDHEAKRDPQVTAELVILAESAHVPSNGLCVRKDLTDDIKAKLKSTLLGLHSTPEGKAVLQQFGALQFIETTANDYQPVLDMTKKVGIDIMTYDYSNK